MSTSIARPRTESNARPLFNTDHGDAEAALVAEGIRAARQSRRLAREERCAAHEEQIDKLRAAADKLRFMADCSLVSGIVHCTVGVATAMMSCINTGREVTAQRLRDAAGIKRDQLAVGPLDGNTRVAISRQLGELDHELAKAPSPSRWLAAGERMLDGFARADIPAAVSRGIEGDKRELEIRAELAAKRASEASDQIDEADRMERSLKTQLERLHQARLACTSAAIRR